MPQKTVRLAEPVGHRTASPHGGMSPNGHVNESGVSTMSRHLKLIAAVAVVLLLGLVNMMRGGSPNKSQKLMRLRVLLQFVAIVIIMLTVWAMSR